MAIAHSPPDQPDANAPTGTLFAIFDAAATAEDSFLRPARQMRAAGYVMHGPRCLMVLTCGDGVQVQALDGWAFAIERARATLPDTVRDLAIDMSQYRHWPRPVRAYVDDCLAGVQGPRGRTIDLRWTPSLVAEAHRILMRGGIYLAPADARSGHARGSLSMLHQAAPIAFLIEQAGGRATDGALPILDAVITGFDSRTPLVFGCIDKVDRRRRLSRSSLRPRYRPCSAIAACSAPEDPMSHKHPIISVTGSSGAGTTTVKSTFDQIFRREGITAVSIEGDAFHRYDRAAMKAELAARLAAGDATFSHFSFDANELQALEEIFRVYGETGRGQTRHYVHDDREAERWGTPPGTFTDWAPFPDGSDLLFYEGLHGAVANDTVNLAALADLKIGVVPVINLEWIQKIHRDSAQRGYSTEAVTDTILRRMHAYVHCICPQFTQTDIKVQRVPVVDTSNPFIARWIPTADESLVVIRFRNPRGIDFPYLTSMIHGSWMSRANSIVVPGPKMDLAMQLILTPMILRLTHDAKRA